MPQPWHKRVLRKATPNSQQALQDHLQQSVNDFETLAQQSGLPWIDRHAYREQLLRVATIPQLPQVEQLNNLLESQISIANQIRDECDARETLLDEMKATCCAFDEANRECTTKGHEKTAKQLRQVDDMTDHIIHLIQQWRARLSCPLPFLYRGENYLQTLGEQCSINHEIACVSAHLRATSRHCSFFYASPYDPVVTQSGSVLERDEVKYLEGEYQRQIDLCEEQLTLAKMGVCVPVLRFKLQPGKPMRAQCVLLDNLRWKKQLVLSYGNALRLLKGKRQAMASSSSTSAAMQFVTMSTRSLHLRYLRRWVEWIMRKRSRNKGVIDLVKTSLTMHMQCRFSAWMRRHVEISDRRDKYNLVFTKYRLGVLQTYMQNWFTQHACWRLRRSVRRAMYLKYFHAFQFLVLRKQLRQQRDKTLRSLHIMGQLRPMETPALKHVRNTIVVHRPWLVLMGQEEDHRTKVNMEFVTELMQIAQEFMHLEHQLFVKESWESYRAFFTGDIDSMVRDGMVADEATARRHLMDVNAFNRAEMRSREIDLLLDSAERDHMRGYAAIERSYMTFVFDNFELLQMSHVMCKRESLKRREARSRHAIIKRCKDEAPIAK